MRWSAATTSLRAVVISASCRSSVSTRARVLPRLTGELVDRAVSVTLVVDLAELTIEVLEFSEKSSACLLEIDVRHATSLSQTLAANKGRVLRIRFHCVRLVSRHAEGCFESCESSFELVDPSASDDPRRLLGGVAAAVTSLTSGTVSPNRCAQRSWLCPDARPMLITNGSTPSARRASTASTSSIDSNPAPFDVGHRSVRGRARRPTVDRGAS